MIKQAIQFYSLILLGFFITLSISCREDDENVAPSAENNLEQTVDPDCDLKREILIDFNGGEKVIEWRYENGIRVEQRTNFPPNSIWLDSMRFSYTSGLIDTLQTYQRNNPNYNRLHVFRHDTLGRLTRIVRFDAGVRSGTETLKYTSNRTGLYQTDGNDYKFELDSLGNLVKLKLLNPSFAGQTQYFYYVMSPAKNPHYRKATYPLNVSQYLNPNYIANIVSFPDSTFDHDSAVAVSRTV
jgi:hypothetical protein